MNVMDKVYEIAKKETELSWDDAIQFLLGEEE